MKLCLILIILFLSSCQTKHLKENLICELRQTIKEVRKIKVVHDYFDEYTGNTDLIKAVIFNDLALIKELLKKNHSLYEINDQGLNALEIAAYIGDYETVLYLIRHAPVLENNLDEDLVFISTWNGDNNRLSKMILYRLKRHYNKNIKNFEKALKVLNKEMIDFALLNILEQDLITDKVFTPFVYTSDTNTVDVLFGKGYKLNTSVIPLMFFSYQGNLGILNKFWHHFPPVDSFNHYGETALMSSIENDKIDVIKFLISKGANPFLSDIHGETSFDKAKGKAEILKILNQSHHKSMPANHMKLVMESNQKYFATYSTKGKKDAEKHFNQGFVFKFHGLEGGNVPSIYDEDKGIFIHPWYLTDIYSVEEIAYRKGYCKRRDELLSIQKQ